MFGWFSKKRRELNRLLRLSKQGNMPESLALLAQLGEKYPNDDEVAMYRAIYLKQDGQHAAALENFERAKKSYQKDSSFWEAWGEMLMDMKRFNDALEPLDHALKLSPSRTRARLWRGICRSRVGRNSEALTDCEIYLKAQPNEPTGYYLKASISEEMWEPDAGLKAIAQALQINPKHTGYLSLKARLLSQAGRPHESLAAMDAAFAAGLPKHELHNRRAHQLVEAGRFEEAIPLLNTVIQQYPDRDWYLCRARAYEGMGDGSRAIADRKAAAHVLRDAVSDLSKTGVQRTVVLIQAGVPMYSPGDKDGYGLALLTFDDTLNADVERQLRLARALFDLKSQPLSEDPVLRAATNAMTNDQSLLYRRQPLPVELTEGAKCYTADIRIYRDFLPEQKLTRATKVITVLAEPGDTGRMEMLPLPGSIAAT